MASSASSWKPNKPPQAIPADYATHQRRRVSAFRALGQRIRRATSPESVGRFLYHPYTQLATTALFVAPFIGGLRAASAASKLMKLSRISRGV